MRISIAGFVLACTTVTPLFCQAGPEAEPLSSKDRELKACGTKATEVKYVADTDKKSHPMGEQTAGKVLIYVLRPGLYGNKIQTKLAADGEWKGVNRGNNYFFFTLEPGLHYFCSQAENRSVLVLTTEPGKTYYLEQDIHTGVMKARNDLGIIGDAEGVKRLAKLHPSTWEVKK